VFDRDARWEGTHPPAPHFWMHQLGTREKPRVKGPFLDAAVFSERVADLLSAASQKRPAA
jgi:hypothetical protein